MLIHQRIMIMKFIKKKNNKHKIKGYCISCEEKDINHSKDDNQYKLTNISHGSHTIDFLALIQKNEIEMTSWIESPVMFVFESPSRAHGDDIEYKGVLKKPSPEWYWVEKNGVFPSYFKGGQYGNLISSIINTFKLKNAYVTNLVKCGLNNEKGDFKGIDSFNEDCISNCYSTFLKREIEITSPRVVFTFGNKVYEWVKNKLASDRNIPIYYFPHPARQRVGFTDEFYKVLYFWIITKGLYINNIITDDFLKELTYRFIKNGKD